MAPTREVRELIDLPPGRFRLVRELGEGGMGVVYEAEDVAAGRRVALKVLRSELGESHEALQRFRREARLAASISDPHCVFVYGVHRFDGSPAIAMELVPGRSLQDCVRVDRPVPVPLAVEWTLQIVDGLEAAARAGVLHRDVKPSNCFLAPNGSVKVGDFGLSKSLVGDSDLTVSGGFLGTPNYASPEQARGRNLDVRSDLYSVGATLYALLRGRPPFDAAGPGEVIARVLSEEPEPLREARPEVPEGLEEAIRRAMHKEPGKRFQDYAGLRAALRPYASMHWEGAGLRDRMLAGALDVSVAIVAGTFVSAALLALGAPGWDRDPEIPFLPKDTWMTELLVSLTVALYFFAQEVGRGRTLGKRLFGLRVVQGVGSVPVWRSFVRSLVFSLCLGVSEHPLVLATGWGMLLVPARRNRGQRGLHELVSGTRVVRELSSAEQGSRTVPSVAPSPADDLPTAVGRFDVVGRLLATPSGDLLVGRDGTLDREVWVLRGHSLPASLEARGVHSALLRVVDPHPAPGAVAFESPGGTSLCAWLTDPTVRPWTALVDVLHELAEHCVLVPGGLSLDRLWIDSNGRPRVLDFEAASASAPSASSREVIAAAVGLALSGGPGGRSSFADLPCQVERTLRVPEAGIGWALEQFAHDLGVQRARRPHLSRLRRLAGMLACLTGTLVLVSLAFDTFSGEPLFRFAFPVGSATAAFLLRGGIGLRLQGICVRTEGGARASRGRCALRSLLLWFPWLLPALVEGDAGRLSLAILLYWVAHFVTGIWHPAQGLVDRIARTRLVPA